VFTVLTGAKNYFNDLAAIVTMADDGGSAGVLREEFGILPPGDIRRALMALSASDNKVLSELFAYRFEQGSGLTGHSFGNLMITALERITGDFTSAINEAGKILSVNGKVFPVTLKRTSLNAELEDGSIIKGETNIDVPSHNGHLKIKKVWLKPSVSINPAAEGAILDADLVIIGPGDLYTSLIPNLLVSGVPEALRKTKGRVAYIVNLMTKFGETNGFRANDFLRVMEDYVGEGVLDYAILNNKRPSLSRLVPYAVEKAEVVEFDSEQPVAGITPIVADVLRDRGFIRHDPEKLAKVIKMIV